MKIRAAVLERVRRAARRFRSSSWPSRRPARSSCASSPAASATPTSTPPRAPIRPATRRPCSATRAPASSRRSATASPRSRAGDHVVTLFSPQCGECVHCRDARTNLCLAIREQQNLGYLPDGTTRLSRDGEPIRHFMGTLDLRRVHGDAGDRAREGQPRGAARPRLPVRLRPLDRARRGDQHGEGRAGLDLRRLRRRAWSGSARSPAAACRAPSGSSASTSRRSGSSWRAARARPTRSSAAPDAVERILEMTGGFGADYTFEATGNVARHAPGGRGGADGLGPRARSPASPARARRSTSSRAS